MDNHFLDEGVARDIDVRISKILKDLGNPPPPLSLGEVRELLRLDLHYYSANNMGIFSETIHRLKVAGKQILERPGRLWDAIKSLNLKALWAPDRRRILIDSELPNTKKRWGEAHEIGHSLLPWHEAVLHGDPSRTLSLSCEEQIEGEANYAAGRLLFMQNKFEERILSSQLSFSLVKNLSKEFANSITSTLWRAVECYDGPAFGMVSAHPTLGSDSDSIRYFVRSRSFKNRFPTVREKNTMPQVRQLCRSGRGPIGNGEIEFQDATGGRAVFGVEVFFNGHEALTIGVYQRTTSPLVAMPGNSLPW